MLRLALTTVVTALLATLAACTGGSGEQPAAGEFIDSRPIGGSLEGLWNFPGDASLPTLVTYADAVVVLDVLEIVDVTNVPPPFADVSPDTVGLLYTTYRVRVEQWIKGSGKSEFLVTQLGGISPDHPEAGPIFFDGDFLLEPGRSYALLLRERPPDSPGDGQYRPFGAGRGGFEVTDGFVHVLNHSITRNLQGPSGPIHVGNLQELYGGMPQKEFVAALQDYVANPPPPEALAQITPPPEALRPDGGQQSASGGPTIAIVAIDTDVNNAPANTATSFGSIQQCNTLTVGGTLDVDVIIASIPPADEGGGGLDGFQFSLLYDEATVKVTSSDANMLLAANSGSSVVPFGDTAPDTDGSFLIGVADFGSGTAEDGVGVLARITLEGVAQGVSSLTLTRLTPVDSATNGYAVSNVLDADVAVDTGCP